MNPPPPPPPPFGQPRPPDGTPPPPPRPRPAATAPPPSGQPPAPPQQNQAWRQQAQHAARARLAQQQAQQQAQQAQQLAQRTHLAQQQAWLQHQHQHQHQAQQQAWLQHQQYTAQYVTAQARANPTPRPTLRTWLLGGIVVVGSLFLALCFALYFGLGFGVVATFLGLIFALIPLVIVVPIFLWLDRFEPEPWRYLVTAFLYGALVSTFFSIIFNTLGGVALQGITDAESADVLTAVIIAPLTEETLKGLFLLIMWAFLRKEFNGLTDGIVYAGIVAAGFAFTENIQYLANAYFEFGGQVFAGTFVMRGLISPFLHPMFTTMTGIGVGIAATSRSLPVKIMAPIIGWSAAVLAHGLWNLGASTGGMGLMIGLGGGFVAFVTFLTFVIWARSREGRIIGVHLRPYASTGWLTPAEVNMLASLKQRRNARSWARLHGGAGSLRSMRAFQDSASELALLRSRMLSNAADMASLHQERVLLDSMTARRREFVGVSYR